MANISSLWWTTGRVHPMKGRKNPMTQEWKDKIGKGNKGKVLSKETREKVSISRRKLNLRGENSPLWKGKKSVNAMIRGTNHYKEWRFKAFKEGGFNCVECNQWGGELNLHHKVPLARLLKINDIKNYEEAVTCGDLWDYNNTQILCLLCHQKTDSYLNKKTRRIYYDGIP